MSGGLGARGGGTYHFALLEEAGADGGKVSVGDVFYG